MMYNVSNPNSISFPIPFMPKIFSDAINDAHRQSNAPIEIGVLTALATMSLAAQHRFDVERPGGIVSPSSIFTLTIADSGEGKTTVVAFFTHSIKCFMAKKREEYEAKLNLFNVENEIWQRDRKALLKFGRTRQGEMDEETIRDQLIELENRKPVRPRMLQLLYSDTTFEALLDGLNSSWPSAGWFSDEGSIILERATLQSAGQISGLWGGNEVQSNRKTSENFVLTNPQLTIFAAVQSKVFQRFMQKKGEAMSDAGLLARFLIAWPESTQGTRYQIRHNPYDNYVRGEGLAVFNQRVTQLLDDIDWDNPNAEKRKLTFSTEAAALWTQFDLEMDFQRRPSSDYASIRPFVAKAAEHCARIAGLFHLSEFDTGEISSQTMQQAIAVVRWFLDEHLRVMSLGSISPLFDDAEEVFQYLQRHAPMYFNGVMPVSKVSQGAPGRLRKNRRFRDVLNHLRGQGRIVLYKQQNPKTNRLVEYVALNYQNQNFANSNPTMIPINQPIYSPMGYL